MGMTQTSIPASWNPASYLHEVPAESLAVAPWVDRLLIFRRVRRSMTNRQYVAFCKNHEPIR